MSNCGFYARPADPDMAQAEEVYRKLELHIDKCKYFSECGNSQSFTCNHSVEGPFCGTFKRKERERGNQ